MTPSCATGVEIAAARLVWSATLAATPITYTGGVGAPAITHQGDAATSEVRDDTRWRVVGDARLPRPEAYWGLLRFVPGNFVVVPRPLGGAPKGLGPYPFGRSHMA